MNLGGEQSPRWLRHQPPLHKGARLTQASPVVQLRRRCRGGVSEADGGVVKRQSPFYLEHIVPLAYNVRNISVSSIRNAPFHIDTEVPKGGVWQGRTVALAISGQKPSSFPKKFNCKGGDKDKRKAASVQLWEGNYSNPICDLLTSFIFSPRKISSA